MAKHIRFNSAIAGLAFAYSPGDVVIWPDDAEAERLCERGIADELTEDSAKEAAKGSGRPVRVHRVPKPETATRRAPETAATR